MHISSACAGGSSQAWHGLDHPNMCQLSHVTCPLCCTPLLSICSLSKTSLQRARSLMAVKAVPLALLPELPVATDLCVLLPASGAEFSSRSWRC